MMSERCDVLLLAAFHPELEPLRPVLGDAMRARIGGTNVAARVTGIGLPMAAAGAAVRVAEIRPRAALVVGTCGGYPGSGLAMGEVVVARRIHLVDLSALQGSAQFPGPMSIRTDAHVPMAQALSLATGARPADVATTLAITTDDAIAVRVTQETGAHVEHLEAHGVATACQAQGVPFGAVLAMANVVGSRGRDEWRVHHERAARAVADAVVKWLEGGWLR